MTEEFDDLLAQRREEIDRFCRMADVEQKLAEEWLKDATDQDRYSAWYRHERWLVSALNEWRQATDALFNALDKPR
jgi:hypothetical protein